MNITFLIGNGFDLSLGLNTRYHDFYDWYCRRPSGDPVVDSFKAELARGKNTLWADFELGLGRMAGEYGMERQEAFFDCYDDAQEKLAEYLAREEGRVDDGQNKDRLAQMLRDSLPNYYEELQAETREAYGELFRRRNGEQWNIRFLSFNYTRLLDRAVQSLGAGGVLGRRATPSGSYYQTVCKAPIHVHGYTDRTPVLGVNDWTQVGDEALCAAADFAYTMLKPYAVRNQGDGWDRKAEELIRSSDLICIFGMSLGETDKKWWQEIGAWMQDGGHKLLIFAHGDQGGAISLRKQKAATRAEKEKFLRHLDLEDFEREDLEGQIYVIWNSRRVFRAELELSPAEDRELAAV